MSEINVKVHSPAGTEVKVTLDGRERNVAETTGKAVSLKVEQMPAKNRPTGWELYKLYFPAALGKRIRYGTDVPSPFRACFTANVEPGTDGEVPFTLVAMEGEYRLIPERDCFIKGSTESCQVNDDHRIWAVVMCTVLLPLLIVFGLAVYALLNGRAPMIAKTGIGVGYGVVMLGAVILFFTKIKRKKKYTTRVE